ncbi:hypothetical protein Tco_1349501 [Tanacetum coccineum]
MLSVRCSPFLCSEVVLCLLQGLFEGNYRDHVVLYAGIIGIKHRHNVVRDTLFDIYFWPRISASKEVDIGLSRGRDKPLHLVDMLCYSWDEGLDLCIDLTGSSPLMHTRMVDSFVSILSSENKSGSPDMPLLFIEVWLEACRLYMLDEGKLDLESQEIFIKNDQPNLPHLEHEQDRSIAHDRPCRNEKARSLFGFEENVTSALQVAKELESLKLDTYREAITFKESNMFSVPIGEEIESLHKNNT